MESASTAGLDPSSQTPTVPPPPDLSDGTPVYLYAVICSSVTLQLNLMGAELGAA